MIILTLLHPTQAVPVQSWSFESESVIRIGRANDNDVIIYSAVVSRHHLELCNHPSGWEMTNFGTNGTYVEDRPITQGRLVDGIIIRLGNSGPKIRVRVGVVIPKGRLKTGLAKRSLVGQINEASNDKTTFTSPPKDFIKEETTIHIDNAETQVDFD